MKKKLLMGLVALLAAVGLSIAVVPPASAAWTGNSCKQVDVSSICVDFDYGSTGATNSYRIYHVRLCLYSQTPNNNDDTHSNKVVIKGGSGAVLGSATIPTVQRNTCQTVAISAQGGSAMTGTQTGTLNINPWPPLAYPDIDYSQCRKPVFGGGC